MNIGRRMREAREALGMPGTTLARRVGVANNTIWRIEAGRRTPSLELLEKVARELRTDPAELMREPPPTEKGEVPRGVRVGELGEEQLRAWRQELIFVLDSASETSEMVAGRRAVAVRSLLEAFLEEWGNTFGDDPEIREAQERLRPVWRQLSAFVHGGSYTPISAEQESALRMFLEHLAVLLEASPFAGLEEERHDAEASLWIDYLDKVTDRWLPLLWRARPPVKEALPLEEVRQISGEASDLAGLYIERRDAVRRECSAEQREALDNLEEALEEVLNLSGTQFEKLLEQRQHEQQGIPNLTEWRKEREKQKHLAMRFHRVRHVEVSA